MKNRKVLGFTLIELLIVIAIIGILAVAFLPSLLNAPAKGRDAQRVATIQKLEGFLVTQMLVDVSSLKKSGCIKPDSGDDIAKQIKENLSGFAGVFPADPDSNNPTISNATDVKTCTGGYGYVKFATGGPYTAGVFVAVENAENGNIKCSSIGDDSNSIALIQKGGDTQGEEEVEPLTPSDVGGDSVVHAADADADADTMCYLALLQ